MCNNDLQKNKQKTDKILISEGAQKIYFLNNKLKLPFGPLNQPCR